MPYAIAAVLLALFTMNVAYGAIDGAPILGNVAEMLLLLSASIVFVVGILRSEAASRK